jgi:DNA repair exonuclease SbcCD ATPase subunit
MYGHLIRTGRGPYPLESFLREFPYYWNTAFQKERWGRVFGKRKFLVLSYEDLKGESILLNFLEKLFPGHAILSTSLEIAHDADSNLSYSPRFLRFMEELSANQVDSAPYARLYAKVLNSIVPLERRMLSPTDIDEAMKRCGMKLDSSGSAASNLAHQRGRKRHGAPNLEQVSNDLTERTREFIEARKGTAELVELRELLSDRTNRLEECSHTLLDRTEELVQTRETLVERTDRLKQASQDLVDRTQDLEETREALAQSRALLEQAHHKLEELARKLALARDVPAEQAKVPDKPKQTPH